ncbi:unnamed protein product [Adineta ricciae]|uniref:Uncharacterized protein n=1 Tax=Adineta ricciae TaxID=249248 RepID=A0A814SFC1_ADIRI|nr:unnamed protein product [Adineta ricciae]CAF1546777.1 unnamed protein product [Adineta ricciae]
MFDNRTHVENNQSDNKNARLILNPQSKLWYVYDKNCKTQHIQRKISLLIIVTIVVVLVIIIIPIIVTNRQNKKGQQTLTTTFSGIESASSIITLTETISRCNVTSCRERIQKSIAQNWTYDTVNFTECNSCSRATYPNFPSDWSTRWYDMNFLIYTSESSDCAGNPYIGNVEFCQYACLKDITCIGFSRAKAALDNSSSAGCYLKKNINLDKVYNHDIWYTIIFRRYDID